MQSQTGVMSDGGHWDFHVQTLVSDFERDSLGLLSPRSRITYVSFQNSLCYFSTTNDPNTGKEWIHNLFVNEAGELTLSKLEKINCCRLQITVVLQVIRDDFKSPSHSRLKSRQNILRLPQKHRKTCFHFQHPIFV